MKKTLVTSVILAAGLTVAGFASAGVYSAPQHHRTFQAHPWYVGVGVNYYAGNTEDLNYSSDSALELTTPTKIKNNDIGWNIFAGRDICRHFAAEGGFTYLGNNEWEETDHTDDSVKTDSNWFIYFDGLAHVNLNKYFELFAKGGVDYFDGEIKADYHDAHDTLHTFGLNYGAGLQFNYQQFGARLSYTQLVVNKVQKENFTWSEPSFIALDFLYHFG